MATRRVRFEFNCERSLTFHHELPAGLIGAGSVEDPGYKQLYISALQPVMREHTNACIAASQATCAICETSPTKQVLTTPMSYLHMADDPFVVVLVTPVCEKQKCNTDGTRQVNEIIAQVTGMQEGELAAAAKEAGPAKISRNAHCPCGSSRKYKKCCGVTADGE
jgi:hypothetical protein